MVDKDIKVVPNGVNCDRFKPLNKKEQRKWVEDQFGVDLSSSLNIINVGRLSQEKGLLYLIESLRYLDPKTKLFIVGSGRQKDNLKELSKKLELEKQVIFMGKVAHEQLPSVLNAMNIFVLPAISMEGFSNSMLEAMACGLPVVTTPIGAGAEVIKEDIGVVVETKNPKKIADGIIKCSNLDGGKIREYVEVNFSFNVVAKFVYDLYSQLCEKEVERICYCSLFAPPFLLSGAGMQVHELSKALSNMCDVSVISARIEGEKEEVIDGVRYYRVKYTRGEAKSRFVYSFMGSLKGLSLGKFDVIDGRNWEGGLISVFVSKHGGSKSVMSFRGEGAVDGPWIKKGINRFILKRVDLATATDKRTAELVKRALV